MRTLIFCFLTCCIIGCASNKQSATNSKEVDPNTSSQEYKPNPDEVIIRGKLVAFESGLARVEVIEQLAVGFSVKMLLTPGEIIDVQSDQQPPTNIICALEVNDGVGGKKFRITRIIK